MLPASATNSWRADIPVHSNASTPQRLRLCTHHPPRKHRLWLARPQIASGATATLIHTCPPPTPRPQNFIPPPPPPPPHKKKNAGAPFPTPRAGKKKSPRAVGGHGQL